MPNGNDPIDLILYAMQMTREQVTQVLIYRIERDQAYLQRCKRQGQRMVFDTLTETDLLGFAMTVDLLSESKPGEEGEIMVFYLIKRRGDRVSYRSFPFQTG